MKLSFYLLVIPALLLTSCAHHQETSCDSSIDDEMMVNESGSYDEEVDCEWRRNPYVDDVEGDPNLFKKIEKGDTDAFMIYYNYTSYTYKREDISNVIKYALLLENKYHYSYGYHCAAEGYVLLYEKEHHLSDSEKKKLVLYCWKSYHKYNKLESVYRLRDIYKGGFDPSMQDEEQYKICDSIIETRREMWRRNGEKKE